jgi:type IV pilus assembly protein PilX
MKNLRISPVNQHGAALFVSLMMLVLVTILGVTGVRLVSLEEKMAGNSYDRNLAFQSAEAALRVAENYIETQVPKPDPSYTDADNTCPTSAINNCTTGICPKPDKDCTSRWESSAGFTQWVSITTNLGTLAGTKPQYFVEYLGATFNCRDGVGSDPKNCKRYRITACSRPGASTPVANEEFCKRSTAGGRANVMLQSIYATN